MERVAERRYIKLEICIALKNGLMGLAGVRLETIVMDIQQGMHPESSCF